MTVFETIDPDKDVDGFSPVNVGRLVQNRATLRSCTPAGVMEMLRRSDIPVAGRHAVVIGRSDIVGKPMALMLLHANATVTICHSRTADLPRVAATADILVVAIGRAGFVTPAFVKPGATVDRRRHEHDRRRGDGRRPGSRPTRRATPSSRRRARSLVGDVDPRVASVAGALTPVPRGVGPLTIAMLMNNTVVAAESRDAIRCRAPTSSVRPADALRSGRPRSGRRGSSRTAYRRPSRRRPTSSSSFSTTRSTWRLVSPNVPPVSITKSARCTLSSVGSCASIRGLGLRPR